MSWRESELNTSSWWEIDKRDKGDGHENAYHGNFVPRIPAEYIERFTAPGDWVFDPFLGSGTTVLECVRQGRNCFGTELNPEVYETTCNRIDAQLALRDEVPEIDLRLGDNRKLKDSQIPELALTLLHPPYLGIIRFNEGNTQCFGEMHHHSFHYNMGQLASQALRRTRMGGHLVVVVGDVWNSKGKCLYPLGASLTNEICRCRGSLIDYGLQKGDQWALQSIVVKNVSGTRAQQKNKNLQRMRALRDGRHTFNHEYVILYKKVKDNHG